MTHYDDRLIVVAEGTPADVQLTFRAQSVIIDNLTASWVYLTDSGRFIPPFTYGSVIPLPGTQSAKVQWVTPNGVNAPTAGTGKTQLTFSTLSQPYTPGIVVLQAQPTTGTAPAVQNQPPVNLLSAFGSTGSTPIAAGANQSILTGVAGKTVLLYGFLWSYTPGGTAGSYFVGLDSSSGSLVIDNLFSTMPTTNNAQTVPLQRGVNLPGVLALPKGDGIIISNSAASAGSITCSSTVYYTLQ